MFKITVRRNIVFVHYHRDYKERYRLPHPHKWFVELSFLKEDINSKGFSIDFVELGEKLEKILEPFQNKTLNELEYFKEKNPTAEHIALVVYELFNDETIVSIAVGEEQNYITLYINE